MWIQEILKNFLTSQVRACHVISSFSHCWQKIRHTYCRLSTSTYHKKQKTQQDVLQIQTMHQKRNITETSRKMLYQSKAYLYSFFLSDKRLNILMRVGGQQLKYLIIWSLRKSDTVYFKIYNNVVNKLNQILTWIYEWDKEIQKYRERQIMYKS